MLPTQLKYDRNHLNNFSNLIFALLERDLYAAKVSLKGFKNALGGFSYEFHGINFLKNVADCWSEPLANGNDIWKITFVGADITAGLNFIGAPENGLYRMLIDLGTNAETVLFSREKAVCTAAAAGPCFEGAEITCGMSASPGAIYAYSSDGYSTVGDKPAAGICGTGLVDIIAELLRNGTVDKTGYIACESYEIAPSVTLTQSDVRKYQLAKSAVCSAVQALIKREQISYDDIENVYISGGFSAKINIENAVITGLLPAELKNKCVSIGNSSLLGTVKYVFEKNDLAALADKMEYADLAADEFFSERFIKNMMFKI